MANPQRRDLPRIHPAIDHEILKVRFIYGRHALCAKVTCPGCGVERWWPLGTLRQQLKRPNFNGQCRRCGVKASRAGIFQWQQRKNGGRRSITKTGYVALGSTFVDPVDLPVFRAMQNKSATVLEHRFNMAKHLGRALTRYECIDHMDGNKTNNDIGNLRIYLRGKQEPGSCPGYGTYYHELQQALVRIRALEGELRLWFAPAAA